MKAKREIKNALINAKLELEELLKSMVGETIYTDSEDCDMERIRCYKQKLLDECLETSQVKAVRFHNGELEYLAGYMDELQDRDFCDLMPDDAWTPIILGDHDSELTLISIVEGIDCYANNDENKKKSKVMLKRKLLENIAGGGPEMLIAVVGVDHVPTEDSEIDSLVSDEFLRDEIGITVNENE